MTAKPLVYCAAREHGRKCCHKATKGRFCDIHQDQEPKYGRPWRRIREAFLRESPSNWVCSRCGQLLRCPQVDHRVPFRGNVQLRDDMSNLQSLCGPCHRVKTQEDQQ